MGLQIGSIFEYSNKNPVFGLLPPSSPFYTPILGFFAITGLPSAGEPDQYFCLLNPILDLSHPYTDSDSDSEQPVALL